MLLQLLINKIKKEKVIKEYEQEMEKHFSLLELEAICFELGEAKATQLFKILEKAPSGYFNCAAWRIHLVDGHTIELRELNSKNEPKRDEPRRLVELEAVCKGAECEPILRIFEILQKELTGYFTIYASCVWLKNGRVIDASWW